ncbi:MAG: DUF1616 domain-containing protein [Thaumarchaeota archaeon]|nr:DUF1616 domain-containing protein [Nitrososphaerota archaeon]
MLKTILKLAERNSGRSVGELVALSAKRLGVAEHEAARLLYRLKDLGYLHFIDPDPPSSLPRYFISSHVVWFWLLASSVVATFLLIYAAPRIPPFTYLRYVFGSLFVLYLPGAALIELLYPKPSDLSQLERLALSIGLSLALVPLVGLILNYTPWGIRLNPIFASLSLLTVALAAGAAARKYSIMKLQLVSGVERGG